MKNGNQYLTFVCEETLEKRDCAKDYRKMFFSFVFIVAFSAVPPFLLTVNYVNFYNFLGIIPLGISLFWWLISLCLASQFIKVCKCRRIFKKAFFSYLFVMIFLCLSFAFSIIPLFTNKTSFNQEGEMTFTINVLPLITYFALYVLSIIFSYYAFLGSFTRFLKN